MNKKELVLQYPIQEYVNTEDTDLMVMEANSNKGGVVSYCVFIKQDAIGHKLHISNVRMPGARNQIDSKANYNGVLVLQKHPSDDYITGAICETFED